MKKKILYILLTLFILLGVCACDPGMGKYVFKQPKENVVEFAIVDVQDYKTFTKIKDLDLSLLEGFYKEMGTFTAGRRFAAGISEIQKFCRKKLVANENRT